MLDPERGTVAGCAFAPRWRVIVGGRRFRIAGIKRARQQVVARIDTLHKGSLFHIPADPRWRSLGYDCTHAEGLAHAASLPWHMSHLRTMPRFSGILRHVVGALEHAILAADALVIEMPHDAGAGIFFIRMHGATEQASRLDGSEWRAVVTICW